MLKTIRRILAAFSFIFITLLFLDFTGTLQKWFGWLARIQFLPAIMALNLAVIIALILITIVFGRIYCSVICPLGIFQDLISWISGKRKKKKMRFSYSPEKKWIRYGVFVLFAIALILGIHAFVSILAPYSSYGRIVQNLFSPVYLWINNFMAFIAERVNSFAFYSKDVWIKSLPTFIIAALTFVIIFILAWKNGRTYCNTICPVGTILSFFSRFSLFRPIINTEKCKTCHICERKCKASCIDLRTHKIDYSRCVDCFDCIDNCRFDAMEYRFAYGIKSKNGISGNDGENDSKNYSSSGKLSRRAFLTTTAVAVTAATVKAGEKKIDGGLAIITDKKIPERKERLTPFGSGSVDHFYDCCTACQLCVSVCPNEVLRPSVELEYLMQPVMSYERGYCRPECVKCSEVCPSGAILKITPEEKTAIHIGTAVVDYDLCVVNTDNVNCGNCARHCPAGAIRMLRRDPDNRESLRIPSVIEERCIGCGACENLCPSRPYSAIHVDGLKVHRTD